MFSLGDSRAIRLCQGHSESFRERAARRGGFEQQRTAVTLNDNERLSKSPKEMTAGLLYFPRMLDKIRLHSRGELAEDYHKNLEGVKAADGVCCNFLRVHYRDLRERTLAGGSDEEILEWCFERAGA